MDDRFPRIIDGLSRRVSRRLVLGASGLVFGIPMSQTAARRRHAQGRRRRDRTQSVRAEAQPSVETFHDQGSFEIGPCPSGVTLVETFTEAVRTTTFFDEAGNPIRLKIVFNYDGVVTNPVTGQTARDPGHGTRTIDLIDGTRTLVGLFFSTTLPGVGVVFHDVGRLVRGPDGSIIFEAGPHDVLHGGGAPFCAALGA